MKDLPDEDEGAEESFDMDADLREAFGKHKEALESESAPAPVSAPAPTPTPPPTPAAPSAEIKPNAAANMERRADGTFKRKAPTTWRKEVLPKWDTLDPDVQDEVEKRENEIRDGIAQYKSRAEVSEQWEKAVQPYMATIQSLGVPPQRAVQALFSSDHTLRYGTPEQKIAALRNMAKSYGVQLEGLPQEQQAPPLDPRIQALANETAQLKQILAQRDLREKTQTKQQVSTVLDTWRKDKQHYDAVKDEMARMLETGIAVGSTDAEMLQDAYDKAVWGRADLRNLMLAEQQAGKSGEAAKLVTNARASAAVNVPVKGKVAAGSAEVSWEDEIAAGVRKSGMFGH